MPLLWPAMLLVTNHSLFFCDLAAEGFLLPPTRYWVVDEAHGAEAEARRALAVKLDAAEIVRLANRLAATDAKRNPFVRLERRAPMNEATMPEASSLFYGLTEKAAKAGRAFSGDAIAFSHHMKDLVACDTNRQNRNYENIELWINDEVRASQQFAGLREYGKKFQESAEKLVAAASELVAFLEGVDGVADVQRDVATVVIDAKGMLQACDLILNKVDENYVYAAKLSRKPERVAECLEALIVNIGATLDETLYEKTHSVVYASATIAVGDDFKNFLGAMGLGETEGSRANTCMLGSSYDFDKNMQVLVLTDIPEPNQPGYLETLEDFLTQAHLAQNGSMLTLFTNRREMEECFGAVDPSLKEAGLRLERRALVAVRPEELLGRLRCSRCHIERRGYSEAAVRQADRPAFMRARGARFKRLVALHPAPGGYRSEAGGRSSYSLSNRFRYTCVG